MKKRKKYIIFIFLIIVISSIIFVGYKYQQYTELRVDNGNTLRELTEVLQQGKQTIRLKDNLSFKWNIAHVFNPYTTDDTINKEVNKDWVKEDTSFLQFLLGFEVEVLSDEYKRLIFVNNNKVIKDITFNTSNFNILSNKINQDDILILVGNNQYKVLYEEN
ncbi:hypothetical protein M670_03954 [Schinkia azotoformans MEV2011]|uniref:Uncharacterized protein n=1 Tax=Schinkia azotoformans MEV2011 TaxID=1348973 RepID=A0A072NHZ0_SCHAZ|nr:hypothetical protein [Schinkia azotoformans]KEF36872.1 hypothetical protein M670_03954 [Schinkia azotoformans MEV2011]MEC1695246.1 hypothetical protein [Schinkia azotoformans]MEC1717548.1 hypothetical protein [Schinkia azotoformans]MEC1723703.1 hypothetical protein [Schinkia azotoformans]MEC1742502.1 hypothetical protein [Schinkia azotoformans]